MVDAEKVAVLIGTESAAAAAVCQLFMPSVGGFCENGNLLYSCSDPPMVVTPQAVHGYMHNTPQPATFILQPHTSC